ncbi:MAG: MBL fold metallo-hydrolase [Calditrichaeota bacterium]|nr:MBL fold metallo-hydrolase [Calditrichota bacterium]
MNIEFLGVGSGLSPELGNNNLLLTSDESDRQILVDCGFSTPPELTKRENGLLNITDVMITHVHSDHIGGLELLGFTSFYVYRNLPDFRKITLHFPTETLRNDVWQILEKGMENAQTVDGGNFIANLETYFDVKIGLEVNIDGFNPIKYVETTHVEHMEAYSIWLTDKVYYSSDTVLLPPKNADLIFQDCQLFESPTSVHTTFSFLEENMNQDQKNMTWLMHYGFNQNNIDPVEHGFKGFVKRFQQFKV